MPCPVSADLVASRARNKKLASAALQAQSAGKISFFLCAESIKAGIPGVGARAAAGQADRPADATHATPQPPVDLAGVGDDDLTWSRIAYLDVLVVRDLFFADLVEDSSAHRNPLGSGCS